MNIPSITELFARLALSANQINTAQDLPPLVSAIQSLRCIQISGDDAEGFLQGQFSNQIDDLVAGSQQLQSYCNPKGRALATFRLLRNQEGFLVALPADLATSIGNRLKLYKMRAKVEITPCENKVLLGSVNLANGVIVTDSTSDEHWNIDPQRSLWLVDKSKLESLADNPKLPLVDQSGWRLSEILRAIGQVYADTTEQFIPQQINLDLTNGVSFTKGCYPGQEIVARIRYLGKLKQRMIIASADNKDGIGFPPATPVFSTERGDSKVGMVVDGVAIGSKCFMTVMVPSSHIEQGDLMVGQTSGPVLSRLPMPYEVTTEFESMAKKKPE